MNRFLHESKTTKEQCAAVVVKNKKNGVLNPRAVYGANITLDDVLGSRPICEPLLEMEVSNTIDGALVFVLASSKRARKLTDKPVWIDGIGWATGSPWTESRDIAESEYCLLSSRMAYKMAKIKNPRKEFDFLEIDDTFSYKELQHLESLAIFDKGMAGKLTEKGVTEIKGEIPVNPSGGSLGMGHLLEATGLMKSAETILQLQGEAGRNQVRDAKRGLVQTWRGLPTSSGITMILSKEV